MRMTAQEAYRLAKGDRNDEDIRFHIQAIDSQIRVESLHGELSMFPYIAIYRMSLLDHRHWKAIQRHYTQQGFQWLGDRELNYVISWAHLVDRSATTETAS